MPAIQSRLSESKYFKTTGLFKFNGKLSPAVDEHHVIRKLGDNYLEFKLRKITPKLLKKRPSVVTFATPVYAVEHTREDGSRVVIHFGLHKGDLQVKSAKKYVSGDTSIAPTNQDILQVAFRLDSLVKNTGSEWKNYTGVIEFSRDLNEAVARYPHPAAFSEKLQILPF